MKTDLEIFAPFAKAGKNLERVGGTNCVIYTRVSTKEQEDGYSLETQKNGIEEYCKKNKLNIVGYFGGVYESAQTDERKEFNRMLNFVRRSREKVAYIMVHFTDRFSRSGANAIYIASELRKENIKIVAVSQPVDTSTASGKFQQNIQFIFSEYDNDIRREKCTSGMREMLLKGYWPAQVPMGYNQTFENKEQKITVNEKGKILRKAFYWKAENIYTNVEIMNKLGTLGVKITKQGLKQMFENPFYCGLIAHNMLNGKIVEGKHEKLISKELFLKVNNIATKNPKGKHSKEFDNVPLKHFMKCGECGTPFSGYLVKSRGLWYYKCNKIGCKCNRNAIELNKQFENYLSNFQIFEKYIEPVKDEFLSTMIETGSGSKESEELLKGRLKEAESKIEKLEERFILGDIERESYLKFGAKYKEEKQQITSELACYDFDLSNIENSLNKYCNLLMNVPHLWVDSDYHGKLELQNLLFPEGILYYRQLNDYRTLKANEFAVNLALIANNLGQKRSGLSAIFAEKSALVAGG
jgi:site-specific DNA recombinase